MLAGRPDTPRRFLLPLILAIVFLGSHPGTGWSTAAPEAGLAETMILDEPGLVAVLSGRNLEGVYADATPWSESYATDGTLSYRDRLGLWTGDWSASDGRFCTFYRSQGINGGCFLVARRGANCFDFYALDAALRTGATREEIFAGRNWTARGWYVEAESSCPTDDRQIVGRARGRHTG
ncbi:hypothetical protein [Jiella avicenniae]|uniref:Uncharacterized protein n=1 Tax=Jiella avicenniae TaxID=2907202 RepID=A0A9X1NZV9_9HYPH|nr:hypothetical protein [Jiella avicenniae]MCE7027421.1 hypothetical protein [Jiella avicenniae]